MIRLIPGVALALLLWGCMGAQNRPMQLISGAGPSYPQEARAAGVEGYVVVHYDVDREGHVTNAVVVEADPEGVFDQAALAAVRGWRYNPALIRGEAQGVSGVASTVRFKIDADGAYDEY